MFTWVMTSSMCLGYVFLYHYCHHCYLHGSVLYLLICLRYHVVDVPFLCSVFDCLIPKFNCWFLFGLFVCIFYLRSLYVYLYFNCMLQYFYWINFSLWYSNIGSCWFSVTTFIHSLNFNLFLVFLNWLILFIVDYIAIIISCLPPNMIVHIHQSLLQPVNFHPDLHYHILLFLGSLRLPVSLHYNHRFRFHNPLL